jgi:hypothetical protein
MTDLAAGYLTAKTRQKSDCPTTGCAMTGRCHPLAFRQVGRAQAGDNLTEGILDVAVVRDEAGEGE